MNHSLSGVNANYITRHGLLENHLRDAQEMISKVVLDAACAGREATSVEIRNWLSYGRIDVLKQDRLEAEQVIALAA